MLIHLGSAAVCNLLQIFNHSWEQWVIPQIWREANMIPILKKGKVPNKANSYRPVSLTSCVVMTMERIVNERLKWYLETEDLLVPEQVGFQQFRRTEDQATYICLKNKRKPSKNRSSASTTAGQESLWTEFTARKVY